MLLRGGCEMGPKGGGGGCKGPHEGACPEGERQPPWTRPATSIRQGNRFSVGIGPLSEATQ